MNVLDGVHAYLTRFVAYPSEHAAVAHTLWIGHAHLMGEWESTPRIAFLSPEPASGKTRALEATEPLVPSPMLAVNATPAAIFRKVGDPEGAPTILFDEIDTVFGPKAKENEELRGLLNAGHRPGGVAYRCVGDKQEVKEFPAYAALALAGLGSLPDTILSRSVVIRMRRRAPGERVEQFRHRIHFAEGLALRDGLESWTEHIAPEITYPPMPDGVEDRDADNWEALIAVADAAGGDWPEMARAAAVALVADSQEKGASLGVKLLQDARTVFGDRDRIHTADLLRGLNEMEESPWGNLKGHPLDSRRLSHFLGDYGIGPRDVRIGDTTKRGYLREDFYDSWERYLDPGEALQAQHEHGDCPGCGKDSCDDPACLPLEFTL